MTTRPSTANRPSDFRAAAGRLRVGDNLEVLPPQEPHVAMMARDGHTNPEIGARLFISPRTVEYHLHKVFRKLGIAGRRNLRDALAEGSHQAGLGFH